MGVFPMCPFPGNDHSIMPDSLVDGYYIEYAPLLRLMRGREWVLKPHVITVEKDMARANLFSVPGGWVIPVVYGREDRVKVRIQIRGPDRPGRLGIKIVQADRKADVRRICLPARHGIGEKEGVPLKIFP